MTDYAWVGAWGRLWRGRTIEDHPLPGEEEPVLAQQIRRAIKRDEWYSPQEWEVYLCTSYRLRRDVAWCFTPMCPWCGNLWDRWP